LPDLIQQLRKIISISMLSENLIRADRDAR